MAVLFKEALITESCTVVGHYERERQRERDGERGRGGGGVEGERDSMWIPVINLHSV